MAEKNYCHKINIGQVYLGNNEDLQRNSNKVTINNPKVINIPDRK